MTDIFRIVIQFAVVLFAISIHESAHAWVADRCGDPTAKLMGRVTLNPIAHIDLIGTIIFPILLAVMGAPVFGWAKPVMVNPRNFRNRRRDGMLVSAAGPISNILVALGVILLLGLFNNPIMQSTSTSLALLIKIATYLLMINIFLAVFNLIPIPPLDGSGILEGLLKGQALVMFEKIKPYGFFILLLIIYTHALDSIANFIFTILFKTFPFLIFIMMKAGVVG
ncbi:MAG: site-2 protease family protein [Acidobacteria bacterium]|nr:site-2 protease family protein [Acidobacteriota bacterium]MBU4307941.1 site-2 protease family protein [Acidobacteriota bacterium]MCG2811809.1 site-2 protease family protein [Candidatus Aminicenantes bacterium]